MGPGRDAVVPGQCSRLGIRNSWIQACMGEKAREDSTGIRAPQFPLSPGKGSCRKCACALNALIKNEGSSFCLTLFKTLQASAQTPICEQPHVGMEMSAGALVPLRDFFLTAQSQHLLEPCNLVLLIIIRVF